MSELGYISYVADGLECGIYNIDDVDMRQHLVCQLGSLCIVTIGLDDTSSFRCQRARKELGEVCSPFYNLCRDAVPCVRNVEDKYTCNGEFVLQGSVFLSRDEFTRALSGGVSAYTVSGILLLVIWFLSFTFYKIADRHAVLAVQERY